MPMTKHRPQKLKTLNGPVAVPNMPTQIRLSQPALGPASSIQPIAPRKVGMMKAAMTLACAQSRPGMSVRDTAQASGTAMAAAISEAKLAIHSVLITAWMCRARLKAET